MENSAKLSILQAVKNKTLSVDEATKKLMGLAAVSFQKANDQPIEVPLQLDYEKKLSLDLRNIALTVLKLEKEDINVDTSFLDLGLDSITATTFANQINERYQLNILPTLFFEFTTLRGFSEYLYQHYQAEIKNYLDNMAGATTLPISHSISNHSGMVATAITTKPEVTERKTDETFEMQSNKYDIDKLWLQAAQKTSVTSNNMGISVVNNLQVPVELLLIPQDNGLNIEIALAGQGQPLLLLGGLLVPYQAWKYQIEALSKHYQLIMFNQPGCGRSDIDAESLSLDTIMQNIAYVLSHLGITDKIPIIGYSFGGILAQKFCLDYPECVSSLTVICSTANTTKFSNDFGKIINEMSGNKELLALMRTVDMGVGLMPIYGKIMREFNILSELQNINSPALVIAAENDNYMLPEYSQAIHHQISLSHYVSIPNANHTAVLTHHQLVNEAIIEFLGSNKIKPVSFATYEMITGPIFKPVTDISLQALEKYISNQEIGFNANVASVAAQMGYLLNQLLLKNCNTTIKYQCFFLTSYLESLDAGLKLARHRARSNVPKSNGKILIFDPDRFLQDYFDPLSAGQEKALVPALSFCSNLMLLKQQLHQTNYAAVVLSTQILTTDIQTIFSYCQTQHMMTVLLVNEEKNTKGELFDNSLIDLTDAVVIGERLIDSQLPFGVCAIKSNKLSPWNKAPYEGIVRSIFNVYGPTLAVAKAILLKKFSYLNDNEEIQNYLHKISVNHDETINAYANYVNPGFVDVLKNYGWHGRFEHAIGSQFQMTLFPNHKQQEVIDCFANVGTCPRGHNPGDVVTEVLHKHDLSQDYWEKLCCFFHEKTGLPKAFPAVSNLTAIEIAITLSLLANPQKTRLLFFVGGVGFTLITLAGSSDGKGDQFTRPFYPVYSDKVFIDPFSDDGLEKLESELTSGKINLVWFEPIAIDAGGVRTLPAAAIQLVNHYRDQYHYHVGVDETCTNLMTGKLLNSEGKVHAPDIVALATALGDSLVTTGIVLTSEKIYKQAYHTNQKLVMRLQNFYVNQLNAHITLHSLQFIFDNNWDNKAIKVGSYFKKKLIKLAKQYDFIKEIRGEGLLLAMQFKLDDQAAFIQQWFGYIFWGACLRDESASIAVSVCPMHFDTIRFMPSLTFTTEQVDIVISTLARVLAKGIQGIVRETAAFNESIGNQKLANFFNEIIQVGV